MQIELSSRVIKKKKETKTMERDASLSMQRDV